MAFRGQSPRPLGWPKPMMGLAELASSFPSATPVREMIVSHGKLWKWTSCEEGAKLKSWEINPFNIWNANPCLLSAKVICGSLPGRCFNISSNNSHGCYDFYGPFHLYFVTIAVKINTSVFNFSLFSSSFKMKYFLELQKYLGLSTGLAVSDM